MSFLRRTLRARTAMRPLVAPEAPASREDRLVEALHALDPGVRALLDLSLRTGIGDDELGELVGRDPWELAVVRSRAIGDVASACGLSGPDGFTETVAALEQLPAERWAAAAEPAPEPADLAPEPAVAPPPPPPSAKGVAQLEFEVAALRDEVERLREQLSAAEAERVALAAEREQLRLAVADEAGQRHRDELARLEAGLAEVERELADAQEARSRAEAEATRLRAAAEAAGRVEGDLDELQSDLAELEAERSRLASELAELEQRVGIESDARQRAERLASHEAELRQSAEDELATAVRRREEAERLAEREAELRQAAAARLDEEAEARQKAEHELAELRVAVEAADARRAAVEETAARLAAAREDDGVDDAEWAQLAADASAPAEHNGGSTNGSEPPSRRSAGPRPSGAEIGARARVAEQRAHRVSDGT